MSMITKSFIGIIVTAFFAWLIYYFTLPTLSFAAPSFWWYLVVVIGVLAACIGLACLDEVSLMPAGIIALVACGLILILAIGAFVGSALCSSSTYNRRLVVEDTTFQNEFTNVDWNRVPQIDKDSSNILGNRKMGTLTNEVSQFNVMNEYTIINFNNSPVRVSPLGYAGFFKYLNNKYKGIPGYIKVNGVTKEAEYVELEKGMNYSPSAYFSKDLKRYLRKNFKTVSFGEFSFEIDDSGNPYWIIPTYKYNAGIGGAKTPTGCIVLDAVSGEVNKYDIDDIPEWIDAALDPNIVVDMIDSWGKFKNGFWNSKFSQKNVTVSTEGYNYITIGNDIYLYTGITSVGQDESNIGFILVNMRTGKAKYFELDSAEEYSAMDSAKGQVQHLNYTATFPILISVDNTPTYFLSLKDAAGLVKMYAFVSVQNIQIVSVTESSKGIETAMNDYLNLLSPSKNEKVRENAEILKEEIVVNEIYTAIIEGNSYYYIISNDKLYIAPISTGKEILPITKIGETLKLQYYNFDSYNEVISVNR